MNIYYKVTKEKDHMIISHITCFCPTGLSLNNINTFCLTKYILFNKITIKIYNINGTSITHADKQNWYG